MALTTGKSYSKGIATPFNLKNGLIESKSTVETYFKNGIKSLKERVADRLEALEKQIEA